MTKDNLFGSTFETSLRVLLLLDELSDIPLDEQQICCIDFMSVYGADFGLLDENLHGNGMFRFSEFSAKSSLTSQVIKRLILDSLIIFMPIKTGYTYLISTLGKETVSKISSAYVDEYRIAVREVYRAFPTLNLQQLQHEIYRHTINALEVSYNE